MKLLLAPYIIPLLILLPTYVVIISKSLFLTKASLTFFGNQIRLITQLIFQFAEFSFFGCIHFWLFYILKKINLSTVILNIFFIAFYTLLFILVLYDYQNGNFNLQNVLFSTLKAYVPIFSTKPDFSFPLDMIPRNNYNSLSFLKDVRFAIVDEPAFWSLFITFLLLFFAYCIYLITKFKLEICLSVKAEEETQNDLTCAYSHLIDKKFKIDVTETINFDSKYFKGIHIFGLLYITISLCYYFTPVRQRIVDLSSFTTIFNIIFSMTHYEKRLNEKINLLNITRRYLPKGRYWLDNRNDPIYPLVHGDITAFCAYNPNDKKCKKNIEKVEKTIEKNNEKMPNVYFMIIESFNPFSYLINDDFLDEQSGLTADDKKFYVTDTPYYNEKVLPNLARYSKEGIVFSGLASHGLPTLSGMHALLTGVPPSQTIMNIIETSDAHVDDFPSHFHDVENYRTFYATSTDFKYDGLHIWLNRRTAEEEAKIRLNCEDSSDLFDDQFQQKLMKKVPHLKKCKPKEIEELIEKKNLKSFPKWFDYLVGFFPDENQSKVLNLTELCLKKTDWISDRVLSKEIQAVWKQQKSHMKRKKIEKPLLGVTINMETHIPYYGFDNPDQYDKIDSKISTFSNAHKKMRFIRVNKYTDKNYIGEMLDFLKREDNNTIVIVMGDHGTRDVPIRKSYTKLTQNTILSGDCYSEPSGIDSLFITSGAILYLGDDERVKKELKLNKLRGKTVKVATDHNDVIYTILEILSRLKNKSLPPTSRLGRNLIDFSEDIINTLNSEGPSKLIQNLNDQDWQSISYLSYQIEYKRGAKFIRTHSAGPNTAHYYNISSFPTCVKRDNDDDMKLGGEDAKKMFDEMVDYLNVNNHLLYHNRVFNYAFRDEKCIEKGFCELPPQMNHIKLNESRLFAVLFTLPIIVSIFCTIVILIVRKNFSVYYESDLMKKNLDSEVPDI